MRVWLKVKVKYSSRSLNVAQYVVFVSVGPFKCSNTAVFSPYNAALLTPCSASRSQKVCASPHTAAYLHSYTEKQTVSDRTLY